MSKGLEALERMKHHCAVSQEYFYEHFGEDLDIVETELKRYSKIEELCGQTIFDKDCINEIIEKTVDECLINENKLKALEIIKEKRVDVNDLLNFVSLEAYNEYVCACDDNDKRTLTQEEYDLLKEILL